MKSTLPVLLLIISAAAFYFYVNPGYARITGLQQEVKQYETALTEAQNLASTRDALVTAYNNFSSADLARLTEMLPENIDTVRMAAEINGIGQKYGITVKNFSVQEEQPPTEEEAAQSPYRTLLVHFSFDAVYEDFTQFLSDLESSVHIVDVSEIGFKSVLTGKAASYDIALKMYALPQ